MKHEKQFLKSLHDLRIKSRKDGIDDAEFESLLSEYRKEYKSRHRSGFNTWLRAAVVSMFVVFVTIGYCQSWFSEYECIIDQNPFVQELARPLSSCTGCTGFESVPVLRDIDPTEFMGKYAFSGLPVLIKGATVNWTASDVFSYEFFKNLYNRRQEFLRVQDEECQFFGYNTEFINLKEAFDMSPERVDREAGEEPWYFGWSNCIVEISQTLKQYYQRPYFLPEDSESNQIDWIFMGVTGVGAPMHLDTVQRPSWQAQVSGRKTWSLAPVPECENICAEMKVTVETGDIIVLDTNRWYHSTFIHPGKLSITIGSEFD
ncbi:bifunctional arginine demethylase and lysyl-hydroxylase JMJD6-A-like [Tubulanus polymorphus]|uniref:bifunctional arginine demethylase and lysyl-hydroxylase JMJD6-A-like n=1 Tax=Tubulanus polymorphus TaxID=672921 RepID=UPI003DA56AC6